MSYCRWSEHSDVYVYATQHGWTTHVANTGGPHDGESFDDETADECADRLETLAAAGHRVPDGVVQALRAEAAEVPC